MIAGEVRGPEPLVDRKGEIDKERITDIARACVRDIGYEQKGFHWKHAKVEVLLHGQSADIARGVDAAGKKDEGAGDQGIMFGFACRETEHLMPAPIHFAHSILRSLAEARHSGAEPDLGPDAKSQVTLAYEDGKPVRATDVRKFNDCFRQILAGSAAQREVLVAWLDEGFARRELVYAVHAADRAQMTCLVFDYSGRHLHFIDGAEGGLSMAAKALKERVAKLG